MLEVASRHTGHEDTGEKREAYTSLGIPEYWRFDETGEFHGERLPVTVSRTEFTSGSRSSRCPRTSCRDSGVLKLHIWSHNGRLEWYDPETGLHIATLHGERAARVEAETRAERAEARNRELEEEPSRLSGK